MTEKRISEQDVRSDVTAPSGIILRPLMGLRHRKKRSEMSALISVPLTPYRPKMPGKVAKRTRQPDSGCQITKIKGDSTKREYYYT